jgi:FolB domain-containing protein
MAEIKIKNLKLRTILGVEDWERKTRQDIVINIRFTFDGSKAAESDDLNDTVDYKAMKQKIIKMVENSKFFLVEKLAGEVLKICMSDAMVEKATVEIDKPHALRFADSVSVSISGEK